jgi:hypothetical protein
VHDFKNDQALLAAAKEGGFRYCPRRGPGPTVAQPGRYRRPLQAPQICTNIKLVALAEGEISELHIGLKGTMNALKTIVASGGPDHGRQIDWRAVLWL